MATPPQLVQAKGDDMATRVQIQRRSSKTGQFVKKTYADRHPATTETERITHPKK